MADPEQERAALNQQNAELRRKLASAREQERSLVSFKDSEFAEAAAQHDAVAARLRHVFETEASLAEQLHAEQRAWREELAEVHAEIRRASEVEATEAFRSEAELASLLEDNRALARQVGLVSEHGSSQASWAGAEEEQWHLEADGFHRELDGRSQLIGELRERLVAFESEARELQAQLSVRPSAADAGAQRDVLRVLAQASRRLQPEIHEAQEERLALEVGARFERTCAEEEAQARGAASERAEELLSMQWKLSRLRDNYAAMGSRCGDLERRLSSDAPPGHASSASQAAMAEEALVARRSEEDLRQFRSELMNAERRQARLASEEMRLLDAVYQDRATMSELREKLMQSEAFNSRLESRLPV